MNDNLKTQLKRKDLITYLHHSNCLFKGDKEIGYFIVIHVNNFKGPDFLPSLGSVNIYSNPKREMYPDVTKTNELFIFDATSTLLKERSKNIEYKGHLPFSEIIQSLNPKEVVLVRTVYFVDSQDNWILWNIEEGRTHTLHMANDNAFITDSDTLARSIQCHFSDLDWEK